MWQPPLWHSFWPGEPGASLPPRQALPNARLPLDANDALVVPTLPSRPLQMIESEMKGEEGAEKNVVQAKLREVEQAIEEGGWRKQFTAVSPIPVRLPALGPGKTPLTTAQLAGFPPAADARGPVQRQQLPAGLHTARVRPLCRRHLRGHAALGHSVREHRSRQPQVSSASHVPLIPYPQCRRCSGLGDPPSAAPALCPAGPTETAFCPLMPGSWSAAPISRRSSVT